MEITLTTEDQEQLAATLLNESGEKGIIIIAPAVGVKQQFYRHVADYFIAQDYTILTFDYRGIGASANVKNSRECTMYNWGLKDLTVAIDHAYQVANGKPMFLIGHSVAGQLFPLAKNNNKIKRAYFIASQNLSSSNWTGRHKIFVNIFWHLLIPTFTTLTGSLPGFTFGGGPTLPKNIGRNWAEWGKHPKGAEGAIENGTTLYQNVKTPTKFISIADDLLLAPPKAVQVLYDSYGCEECEYQKITPAQLNMKSIGHFKFFKKEMSPLWDDISIWFNKN